MAKSFTKLMEKLPKERRARIAAITRRLLEAEAGGITAGNLTDNGVQKYGMRKFEGSPEIASIVVNGNNVVFYFEGSDVPWTVHMMLPGKLRAKMFAVKDAIEAVKYVR